MGLAIRAFAMLGMPLAAVAAGAQPVPRVITLEEALRTAQERQPQLRQARAGTEAAAARADEARAPLLPQLVGTAGYQKTTGNFIQRPGVFTGTPRASTWDLFNSFSGSITLNQLVFDFGQNFGRWQAAKALAQAQAESERSIEQLVTLTVRTTYFGVRANRALAVVARETLKNLQRHLEQIEGFVEAGTRPPIDRAQARLDLANGQVQVITAENAYEISKAQLNQAMGVAGDTAYDVADETMPPLSGEDAGLEPLVAEAIEARPEVASLQEQVRAQALTLRALQGAYGPTLSANAGSTQGGTKFDQLGWNVAFGMTLSWQMFQGGLTRAQVSEAEATLASFAAQLDLERQQVRLEVDQAWLAVRAAKTSLSAARDAVINARERLRFAEGRYQTGVGSIIELGDAQVALSAAQAQAVQSDYNLATARSQLMRALARP